MCLCEWFFPVKLWQLTKKLQLYSESLIEILRTQVLRNCRDGWQLKAQKFVVFRR